MASFSGSPWLGIAALAGALYGFIGIAFAIPTSHARFWRLAAWGASGIVFVAHIVYERYWRSNGALKAALHATAAVALGGFLLAVGAIIHATMVPSHAPYSRYLIALVAWPVITAIPAFVVGLVFAWLLSLLPVNRSTEK
jgi:hypothetical protein